MSKMGGVEAVVATGGEAPHPRIAPVRRRVEDRLLVPDESLLGLGLG